MTTKEGIDEALKVIGDTGLEGIRVSAPNAVKGLETILAASPAKQSVSGKILRELRRQKLVHISEDKKFISFTLTPAGAYRLQRLLIEEITIPVPKWWDKKWRVITFDVPLRQSAQRAQFTKHLQRLGFVMLQKSLWFYPYPCFEQVEKIAGYYNVLRYCTFFEASNVDELSERRLVKAFSLL